MHEVANWTLNEKGRRFRDSDLDSDSRNVPSPESQNKALDFSRVNSNPIASFHYFFIHESLDKSII